VPTSCWRYNRMLKVAIIGSKGIPARYGGFETLAENLVKHLGKECEFTVYCSGRSYKEQPKTLMGAKLEYLPLDANGVQSIPYDIWSMIHASRKADILLILGVSGCIFLPVLKLFCKGKIFVNLDGMDWQRPKWGKFARAFLKFSETVSARFADMLIADNDAIHDYIWKYYGKDSFLVEYGGDNARSELPEKSESKISVVSLHKHKADQDLIETGFDKYAIAVCRIEPENHIHITLEAFAQANTLPLVFLGNWSNSEYGKDLRVRYQNNPKLLLLDPVFEPRKLFALRSNADLYVHGHGSGGTNPSLVESMSLGLPVLAYDVVFNRATTENLAFYFDSTANLLGMLRDLDSLDLATNSEQMQELARRRYSWSIIADKYARLFEIENHFLPDAIEKVAAKNADTTPTHTQPQQPATAAKATATISGSESTNIV